MAFLLTRRSVSVKLLCAPGPDRETLMRLLTAAARAPDHGKLEPWRFVVLEGVAQARIAASIRARAAVTGQDADKGAGPYETAPVSVAVIAVPRDTRKIPRIEQTLSVGAVCLGLVNAALASGWGATWLTGWPAYDTVWNGPALRLSPDEWVAGVIHIGTCETPPQDRPRPDLQSVTTWPEA